jgi:sugar lactone lactonase YvrE
MKNYIILLIIITDISCKKKPPENNPPSQPPTEKKWIVTTVAGEGSPSFVNGPALTATFHFPEDVAVTADGTIYVTDVLNFCIRKITSGQVSTFAGGSGFDIINGNGILAQFKNPYSITADANKILYTTDENDPRIRKITPGADVSTHAGIVTPGFADGNSDIARFKPGNSIVADAEGNVYVADATNNRIRKVSISGQVTTIAGPDQIASPGGIALDKQESLIIADRGSYRILKITPAGDVLPIAGSGTPGNKDGNAGEAQFSQDMRDIVIDEQENLYLSDGERIRKITPDGVVSTIAGSIAGFKDGEGSQAKFSYPNGLGIDAQGKIYVADLNNNRIRKISFE